MRTVRGKIILPGNAPKVSADHIIIEVRDISVADAPSKVVAENRLSNVKLEPNEQIDFEIPVPEAEPNHTLSFRVHINLDGSNVTSSGDLLTTAHYPVPSTGTPKPVELSVEVI
jgi:putative lipoprotein